MVDSLEKEEIKRGKNEVIPCIYERCFAYVYDQNKNNLAHLLASILNVDVLKIKNNITKISDTNDLKNKNDKQRRMDFVYRIDNLSLDIELNLKPRPIKERNINYLMSLHLRKFKKGNRYEDNYRTIQININNEMIDESDEVIEEYYFRKEDGKEYSKNIGFYVVNIPNIKKIWYNKEDEEFEKYKYMLSFFETNVDMIRRIYEGDEVVMDIINKQEEFSRDNEEWETFRSENELEEEYQLGIEYAKEEGKKEGIEEGIEKGIEKGIELGKQEGIEKGIELGKLQGIKKVVKSMLDKNMDIKNIIDITGLSEEEVKRIINI